MYSSVWSSNSREKPAISIELSNKWCTEFHELLLDFAGWGGSNYFWYSIVLEILESSSNKNWNGAIWN
jgi:hypothetical protein